MSQISRSGLMIGAALVVGCLVALGAVGTALGEDPSHDVAIETPDQIVEGDGQTIKITVENREDEDMTFPLVEVPLQDGLVVPDEDRSERPGDGDGFEDVTVEFEDAEQDRLAFIDESSYRDGEAIFIEGEELPAGDSKTYEFDLTVDTSSEVEIEADVRPLNREENNVRESETVDPVALTTIDAAFEDAANSVTVDGITDDGAVETELPGDGTYQLSADVSILPDELTLDVTLAENIRETVRFIDVESGEADEPAVVARTGSTAEVTPDSASVSFEPGTAATNSTQEVEFDLFVSSGEAHIVIEDSDELPLQGIASEGDFTDAEFVETGEQGGVAVVVQDGEIDDLRSMELAGYPIGDVTLSGDVTADDAKTIADAVASGESLPEYGDVTDEGELSPADAMFIEQHLEGNRTADYEEVIDQ